MCGRGRCCLSAEQVRKAGKLKDSCVKEEDVKRINNFSPGMASSVIISNSANQMREAQQMIFGLVPHFMPATDKPDHYKMFNASKSISFLLHLLMYSALNIPLPMYNLKF